MFLLREDLEISATSTRKGFAEVAIKNGAVLTPGYMLGNSQLYKVAQGSIGAVFEKISRSLRLSLNLFHEGGALSCRTLMILHALLGNQSTREKSPTWTPCTVSGSRG